MSETIVSKSLDPEDFFTTRKIMGEAAFLQCAARAETSGKTIPDFLEKLVTTISCDQEIYPQHLQDIASIEAHIVKAKHHPSPVPCFSKFYEINPNLAMFSSQWSGLAAVLDGTRKMPGKGGEQIMIWTHPIDSRICRRTAEKEDLLALKMAAEGLTAASVSESAGVRVSEINSVLLRAMAAGIITGPEPKIKRSFFADDSPKDVSGGFGETAYTRPRIFALQWHITNACDLHCRHCYDRSPGPHLSLASGIKILDDFAAFCQSHNLFGQVTFTGGNPLMHPEFLCLYKAAADRGFVTGILGNPAEKNEIDEITAIQPLSFFQVSLEGLEPHNDYIRGKGHFKRVISFLELLAQKKIYTKVMLTLTRANQDQVIPLGRYLQDRADQFVFNRLSLQGEGAALEMADPGTYADFLRTYIKAAREYPVMGFKDNLFNGVFQEMEKPLFGGCTGFGCGAAFNFVSVLPTGEVHACRKFESPLGNLTRDSLTDIYHSSTARQYRTGPEDCLSCDLNRVCRGCLASSRSTGLDIFVDKDPYCSRTTLF